MIHNNTIYIFALFTSILLASSEIQEDQSELVYIPKNFNIFANGTKMQVLWADGVNTSTLQTKNVIIQAQNSRLALTGTNLCQEIICAYGFSPVVGA